MNKKEVLKILNSFNHAEPRIDPNQKLIPVTVLELTDENMELFNGIYFWIKKQKDMSIIRRTRSHGISIAKIKLPCYDVRKNTSCVELTILMFEGMWRIQFRSQAYKEEQRIVSGRKAFNEFIKICESNKIHLYNYGIKNGAEVKEQIAKAMIKLQRLAYKDTVFENCHHIDYHSSYPAGLANTHPEFRPIVENLYEKRHNKPINKAILNYAIGFMQSIGGCNARYANLAKDAIGDNNRRVQELAERLEAVGRMVILYNTDGIWYCGKEYHGEGEGSKLGEWSNDHVNCKFRAKSAGCYEYQTADGEYHAIVRGRTNLDKMIPRELWHWGDIYNDNCKVIKYGFEEGRGIFRDEESDND